MTKKMRSDASQPPARNPEPARSTSMYSRRDFIWRAGAAVFALTRAGHTATRVASSGNSLLDLSATEAVAAMVRGDITVEQYASASLAACDARKALNAFITLRPELVLEAARDRDRQRRARARVGALFGLPIPIKDSVNTKDYPTTGGTGGLRAFRPKEDAPLVAVLRRAGAIVLGKTNLHELQWGYSNDNFFFGAVHNPYDPTRIPGGSSGGSAVAVAARMAPLSVAEDTEGSIRVPAALCGIVGFRPTTGRYPTQGVMPDTALFDQLGPHARCVRDIWLFDSVFSGDHTVPQPPSLRGVRLGLVRSYWADLDPEVEQISRSALQRLRSAGAEIVESDPPALRDLTEVIKLGTDPVQIYEQVPSMNAYLREAGMTMQDLIAQASPELQQKVRDILPGGAAAVTDSAYREARDVYLPALRAHVRRYFADASVAAMVSPATRLPATPIGQDPVRIGGRDTSLEVLFSRNIVLASTIALPGLVLPAGLTAQGLPVSLEFDGPHGSDRKLLTLGLSLERALGPLPPPRQDS